MCSSDLNISVDLLEDHRGVGASEAEAVGHGHIDLHRLGGVGDQVDGRLHLGIVQIDRRRRDLIADRQHAEGRLEIGRASCRERV